MVSKRIFENMPVIKYPLKQLRLPSATYPIPRDRSTAPSPTHTAALAMPGERTGVAAKLGERRFFKVALPETATTRYISFWLSGRALDSGQAERQFKSPPFLFFFCLFVSAVLYCCTIIVLIVHMWWVMGGFFLSGWYYFEVLILLSSSS